MRPIKASVFPYPRVINKDIDFVQAPSPERVWFQTGHDKWASREWKPGERAHYCRTVLNREPNSGES